MSSGNTIKTLSQSLCKFVDFSNGKIQSRSNRDLHEHHRPSESVALQKLEQTLLYQFGRQPPTRKRVKLLGEEVVPADGIIISGHSLAIDESSMTGESKILCSSNNELYSPSQALVRTHMVWKKDKKRIRRVRCTCYFPSHCRHP
ncbi:unnamed protein product [Camellia sinensis]